MPAPPDSYTALLVTNQRHHMNWFASERFHWTNIKVNIFLLNNQRSLHNRHYCINYLYKTGHCEAVCYRSSLITNTLALLFVNTYFSFEPLYIWINWLSCEMIATRVFFCEVLPIMDFPRIVVSFGLSFCWWQL